MSSKLAQTAKKVVIHLAVCAVGILLGLWLGGLLGGTFFPEAYLLPSYLGEKLPLEMLSALTGGLYGLVIAGDLTDTNLGWGTRFKNMIIGVTSVTLSLLAVVIGGSLLLAMFSGGSHLNTYVLGPLAETLMNWLPATVLIAPAEGPLVTLHTLVWPLLVALTFTPVVALFKLSDVHPFFKRFLRQFVAYPVAVLAAFAVFGLTLYGVGALFAPLGTLAFGLTTIGVALLSFFAGRGLWKKLTKAG